MARLDGDAYGGAVTSTPSAPPPGGSAGTTPQGPLLPRPSLPPATDVPDDRVHGDNLEAASGPSGSWAPVPTGQPETPFPAPPPGPLPAPAPPTPRANRAQRAWLGMAGVGLALLIVSTGTVTGSETETEVLPITGSAISFEVGTNDVEVLGGASEGKIEVTRRYEWGFGGSRPKTSESLSDGAIELSGAECQGLSWRCSIDYVVRVPDNTAVTFRGGSGDVVLGGALGTVEVVTGSGDVDADGLASTALRVRTGSGDQDLQLGSDASDVTLRAGSGDIDVELRSGPDSLDVETGSGRVSIDAPDDEPFQIEVDTGSGDENIDLASDADAGRLIRVQTGSGDVDIE